MLLTFYSFSAAFGFRYARRFAGGWMLLYVVSRISRSRAATFFRNTFTI